MKKKRFAGIRYKFLLAFIGSMVASTFSIIIIQTLLRSKAGLSVEHIASLEQRYSFVYFVIFLLVMLLFFHLFTKPVIARIELLHECVDQIKGGNFDIQIPVNQKDELGLLAGNINGMINSLRTLIERERQAERMKDELMMSISHDLRTPLTSLSGFLELIKQNQNTNLQICEKYIEISLRKCRELTVQINELLEYSSIRYGEMRLNKEEVGLKEIVEQIIIDHVPQLEQNGMLFHIESEPQKIVIEADVRLMLRMFQNIISNSIQYGKEGKKLDVKISSENSGAIVQIVNYGKPIAMEDMPYIFDRFYRGEKSRSSHTGGKGLGLAIAKRIAELHNGQIEVQSDSKKTAFSIRLPKHGGEM